MNPRVKTVTPCENYTLRLLFENGEEDPLMMVADEPEKEYGK